MKKIVYWCIKLKMGIYSLLILYIPTIVIRNPNLSYTMSNQQTPEPPKTHILMSEDGTQTLETEIMLSVKRQLEMMPVNIQSPEYFSILKTVHKYLHKNCNHHLVSDLIDIDPDRSKTIVYCTICGNTI